MVMDAVQRAAALLVACNKQLLEAARRLLIRGGRRSHNRTVPTTCVLGRVNKGTAKEHRPQAARTMPVTPGGELWQRSILMGEKCDPINFSGAIFYDAYGRRLSGAPPKSPRHPLGKPNMSPLPPPPAASSPKWVARRVLAN